MGLARASSKDLYPRQAGSGVKITAMNPLFFDSWMSLFRTLVVGLLAYCALVACLRISGNRTLSKMNAFDLVVTVALGSTLATVLLNKDVVLAEGVLAFALLIGLQFVLTWCSVRVGWVRKAVTGEPAVLVYQGQLLQSAMRQARVTHNEVLAAIRAAGLAELAQVQALVLETDGSMSVVKAEPQAVADSLADLCLPKAAGTQTVAGRDPEP